MQHQFVPGRGEPNRGLTLQLASSYLLVGVFELIVLHWFSAFGMTPALIVVLTLLSGVGLGLLTTANIQYHLFTLYLSLTRVAEGQKVDFSQATFQHWPLRPLFRALISLVRKEELVHGYHEQLLQQTSEAAALEERNRLARELHDSIKQQLFSIRMSAIAAKAHVQRNQAGAQTAIDDIQKSANEAQVEMQALLQQLRSVALEHTTLIEAVQTQALALEYRSGAQTEIKIATLPTTDRCPATMQEAIFRIIQEGFANIARHARAQHVQCMIETDEKNLLLMIHDDGQGFDPQAAQKGMGLANIQERTCYLNGKAQIESEVGKGTTIQIQVPLLLSLETRQQNEQQELTLQKTIERIHGGLQIRATLATFALVLLAIDLAMFVTNAPIQTKELCQLLLGACFLFMLYGLISAHLAIARARLSYEEDDPKMRGFHFHEYLGWVTFIRVFIITLWHDIFWELLLVERAPSWQIGTGFAIFTVTLLLSYIYAYRIFQRAQNNFYSLLSLNALKAELKQTQLSIRWRIIIFLSLAAPFIIQNSLTHLLANTIWRWLTYYMLFVFFIICLGIAIDLRQMLFWRTRIAVKS